jgi:hypothetical protein
MILVSKNIYLIMRFIQRHNIGGRTQISKPKQKKHMSTQFFNPELYQWLIPVVYSTVNE